MLTLLVLSLEFLDEVIDQSVVEIFTTQVGVTGGSLDFEDTLLDGQEGHIESTTSEIEDEDVPLADDLLVETVSDSSGSGFVDNTEDVKAGNDTGILGGLSLRVVEVGRDGDDGVGDGGAEVGLSGLFHLEEDHGGDFFGRLRGNKLIIGSRAGTQARKATYEFLRLALEFDLDVRLASLVGNLEGEVLDVGLDFGIIELSSD